MPGFRLWVLLICGASVGVALAGSSGASPGTRKPGAGEVAARPGATVVDDTALTSKPGTSAGAPVTVTGVKSAPGLSASPPGFAIVSKGFSNPAGSQTRGTVSCPTGTVAWGGGVYGPSAFQSINSSYPHVVGGVAVGWDAYMNNTGGSATPSTVYAVCAAKPKHYSVHSLSFANTDGSQDLGVVACPLNSKGKPFKAFGGGAYGVSASLYQNINTTIPGAGSWRVDMNNDTGGNSSFTVYVVCGARAGYEIVRSAPVDNPPGADSYAFIGSCQGVKALTGGGGYSSSSSIDVAMNATSPLTSEEWNVLEENNSGSSARITAYEVCVS
jgi:hypothetical protein